MSGKLEEPCRTTNANDSIKDLLTFVNISSKDLKDVSKVNTIIKTYESDIIEAFTEKIISITTLKAVIDKYSSINQIKLRLSEYINKGLFTPRIDEDYIYDRKAFALTHFMVGIEPKWYLWAFNHLNHILHSYIQTKVVDTKEASQLCEITTKFISLEIQIAKEAYASRTLTSREINLLLKELYEA